MRKEAQKNSRGIRREVFGLGANRLKLNHCGVRLIHKIFIFRG